MGIGLSGINSGMDTDAIVEALVMEKTEKKNSLVKAQTKLQWKQDVWKALNTKIYSFYTKTLSNIRMAGAYNKKKVAVSNPNVATVTASGNSVNGTQSLAVKQLAKAGYLTGGELKTLSGDKVTGQTKLSDLGIGSTSINVASAGSESVISIDSETTVKDLVSQLTKAGIKANFDETNQRLFLSAKDSGTKNDFSLTSAGAGGIDALKKLGLYTGNATADVAQYRKWAAYTQSDIDGFINSAYEAQKTDNEKERTRLDNEVKSLTESKEALEKKSASLTEELADLQAKIADDTLTADDRKTYQERIDAKTKELEAVNESLEETNQSIEDKNALINNESEIDKIVAQKNKDLEDNLTAQYNNKWETAQSYMVQYDYNNGDAAYQAAHQTEYDASVSKIGNIKEDVKTDGTGATRINGRDAIIYLNDAKFESSSNTFTINGLTLTAQEETVDASGKLNTVSITTSTDTEGIYNMVKDFLTGYNELINEMDKLYNADSVRGYEPLTDEEKESMTDGEIEKWEAKIKDSLLRRDSSLNNIMQVMKNSMAGGVTINGKKHYLSEFGITTGGYLYAAKNERSAYHIAGDQDDSFSMSQADKLMAAILEDPDNVADVLSGIATNLYNNMTKAMRSTSLSSAFTAYNDKQMKTEYDNYTKQITAQEEKISWWEDYYRSKFTAMEKMLGSLNSQQSSLSGLLGN